MTHFAFSCTRALSASTRKGTPVQVLSSVDHPVTQCMSAVTSTGPRSLSSEYVSVYGLSTRPVTCRFQVDSSKSGIGPKWSTGHVLTRRWPGGMRLAISSGYRGPNSFTDPSSFRTRSGCDERPPRGDRRLDVLVADVNVRDHPNLPRDHA